jgi:hypothetical protein
MTPRTKAGQLLLAVVHGEHAVAPDGLTFEDHILSIEAEAFPTDTCTCPPGPRTTHESSCVYAQPMVQVVVPHDHDFPVINTALHAAWERYSETDPQTCWRCLVLGWLVSSIEVLRISLEDRPEDLSPADLDGIEALLEAYRAALVSVPLHGVPSTWNASGVVAVSSNPSTE